MSVPTPAISVQCLSQTFTGQPSDTSVFRDISFEIATNEFVAIVGPTGCGKSTLINLIGGFLSPTAGQVFHGPRPVTGPGPDRVVIFQQSSLFPWYTVRENLAFGLRSLGLSDHEVAQRINVMLATVGLTGYVSAYPSQLSEGMRKLAEIARALLMKPSTILFDEALGDLDAISRQRMQDVIQQLWIDHPSTVLFVTHDLEESIYLADRIILLSSLPSQIVADVRVNFSRPRTRETRSSSELQMLRRDLYEILEGIQTAPRPGQALL